MKTIVRTAAVILLSSLQAAGADLPTNVQQAIAEFNALNHPKAKQLFLQLVKDEKQKNLANYYLGRIALGDGHYAEATDLLETSVGIEPNSADELYWLSMACYTRLGAPSESSNMGLYICYLQNLETAFGIDPSHLPTLMNLQYFNATGPAAAGATAERAEELLANIASISKADADVARLLVLNNKKETDEALALAQAMIAAYPNSERALLEAGRVLSANQRYPEAIAAFEKAAAFKPTIDNRQWIKAAYVEIGFVSWRTKENLDRGIAAMTKSVEDRFPVNLNTNWAYLRLAQLYQLKGDAAQYKKYWQLLETSPIEKGAAITPEIEKQKTGGKN